MAPTLVASGDWAFSGIWINLISWLITLIIGTGSAVLFNKYVRLRRQAFDRKLLDETLGLIKVFPSRRVAVDDQMQFLADAAEIDLLGFNGFAIIDAPVFVDSTLHKILQKWHHQAEKKLRVLLLDPRQEDVMRERLKQIDVAALSQTEREIKNDVDDIVRNARHFLSINEKFPNVKVELGFFRSRLIWCILRFDKRILLSFYQEGTTAASARTILIESSSVVGKSLIHYFEELWQRRKDVPSFGQKWKAMGIDVN